MSSRYKITEEPKAKRSRVETSAGHCFDESSLCITSLPGYSHQSGGARLHIHPEWTQTHQQLTYTGQEEASRPSMCPAGLLFPSHVGLLGGFYFSPAQGGDEKKIHLLTDSAILDFCYSPSVTWSAPAFTRGGVSC